MIVSSGLWTTGEVCLSELGSVMRCLLGPTGTLFQVLPSLPALCRCQCTFSVYMFCLCNCFVVGVSAGLAVSQMVVSCQTVWVRCVNGELARRYGISDRNPAGDYWKKIPGNTNWFTGETLYQVSTVEAMLS